MDDLIRFGRSWTYAPELSVAGNGYISKGYDKAQRCYHLENNNSKAGTVELTLKGSKESPVINPVIILKKWNSNGAKIYLTGKETKNCKVGINHQLDGDDLVVYISLNEVVPVRVTILP